MKTKHLLLLASVSVAILVPTKGLAETERGATVDELSSAAAAADDPRSKRLEALLEQFSATDCGTGSEVDGCYLLTLTSSENGEDPLADPICDEQICADGRYLTGTQVSLTAAPDLQFGVGGWQGSDDDTSTLRVNRVTMPGQDHTVQVDYAERPDSSGFSSSFEIDRFGDWWREFCDPCDVDTGTVAAGESSFSASTSTSDHRCGSHRALLVGSEHANLDLLLWRRDGPDWVEVAADTGSALEKAVEYRGEPGEYRWEVRSTGRGGAYDLWTWHQKVTVPPPNRLERSPDQSTDGGFSLKSIYTGGSTGRFFLIDQTPFYKDGEDNYTISFKIRPESGLEIKGKKHLILRMRHLTNSANRDATVLEVFLLQVKREADAYGVYVRSWQNDRKGRKSKVVRLPADAWTPIRIEWKAASTAGRKNGLVSVFQPDASDSPFWQRKLSNFGDLAELVYFGQVSKKKKGTAGVVYFDEYRSSWD